MGLLALPLHRFAAATAAAATAAQRCTASRAAAAPLALLRASISRPATLQVASVSSSGLAAVAPATQTSHVRVFSSSTVAAQATAAAAAAPVNFPTETFLSGTSSTYVEDMYEAWLADPLSVHVSWQVYFKNLASRSSLPPFIPPPTILPTNLGEGGAASIAEDLVESLDEHRIPATEVLDHMKVQLMVRAYQVRGHQLANLDPLEINVHPSTSAPELDPAHYGFTDKDLDRKFYL
ncbi:2-oxoglutarate dehydrogenase E1 component, partial [Cladochytrium tenue]